MPYPDQMLTTDSTLDWVFGFNLKNKQAQYEYLFKNTHIAV